MRIPEIGHEYEDIAKKIRNTQWGVLALTVCLILLLAFYVWPISPAAFLISAFLALALSFFLLVFFVNSPINTAILYECNPRKFLAIATAVMMKKSNKYYGLAFGFLCLGDFGKAAMYADLAVEKGLKDDPLVLRALAAFFAGDYDGMRAAGGRYRAHLATRKTKNAQLREICEKLETALDLMYAIADGDTANMRLLYRLPCLWRPMGFAELISSYLQGVAAHRLGDDAECFHRLRTVKELGKMTVFAELSEQYLAAAEARLRGGE